jgi:hypothetical protein
LTLLTAFHLADAKKSGVKESVFKALEPVSPADRAKGGGGGHRFLGKKVEWFRTYKEFFMCVLPLLPPFRAELTVQHGMNRPSLVTGLHFQRSKLALIGSRGVEIMDLETMRFVPSSPPSSASPAYLPSARTAEP